MSTKKFIRMFALGLMALALFALPAGAHAGANDCGSSYVVQAGDTLDLIAGMCNTTVSALYAANPGLSAYLYIGQVLTIPAASSCNCAWPNGSTYIVREGDTFSEIASNFGVSVSDLQAANPQIWDVNYLIPGQVVFLPAAGTTSGSSGSASFVIVPDSSYAYATPSASFVIVPDSSSYFSIVPAPTEESVPLSFGKAPPGTPNKVIQLINQSHGQVYVSLQGTTHSGATVIREYPVGGTMNVKVPVAWYGYVAWVGGQKFEGGFNLGGDSTHSITFYSNRVVVQ